MLVLWLVWLCAQKKHSTIGLVVNTNWEVVREEETT
jgi:hypothetical protein